MSYAAVLRTPHALRTFGSALVGRLSYGTVSLSLLLAVASTIGSYTLAGAVIAVFAGTSAALAPTRAGLVDRWGPRRALPPMAGAYALTLAALAACTWRPGVPAVVLVLLTVAAGVFAPPLGPVMRALWSELVPDPELRRRAFSLDTVCEELLYVSGPLVAGALATAARPAVGVALSALLVLGGTLLLASAQPLRGTRNDAHSDSRNNAPDDAHEAAAAAVPLPLPARIRRTGGLLAGALRRGGGQPGSGRPGPGLFSALRLPIGVAAGVGACLGAYGLLVVVFAEAHGRAASAAWVEAALAGGSAVGGLVLGAVPWRAPAGTRLMVLAAALGLSVCLAAAVPGVPWLAAAAAVSGLTISPTLSTAYLLADELAAAEHRTRAGTMVNTAFNAGGSAGTAGIGLLTGQLPLALCFVLAAAPALAALAAGPRRSAGALRPAEAR